MKKILLALLSLMLVFSACQKAENPQPTHHPESAGAAKPLSKEPPVLTIWDTKSSLEASIGTYSWFYDNGDGTQSGICVDSAHPLDQQEFLNPMDTSGDTVELQFAVQPQEFSVRCWSDANWGNTDAEAETAVLSGNILELKAGGYIYEVKAEWTGENLAAEGTAHYSFYVIRDSHTHQPAEAPQTIADPVTGYCGNTLTTVHMDGTDYTFSGSNSVNLTDIVINLAYDPEQVCRCAPEFTVETESGTVYHVNLEKSFVRCEEGQASLTQDQIDRIQDVLQQET